MKKSFVCSFLKETDLPKDKFNKDINLLLLESSPITHSWTNYDRPLEVIGLPRITRKSSKKSLCCFNVRFNAIKPNFLFRFSPILVSPSYGDPNLVDGEVAFVFGTASESRRYIMKVETE